MARKWSVVEHDGDGGRGESTFARDVHDGHAIRAGFYSCQGSSLTAALQHTVITRRAIAYSLLACGSAVPVLLKYTRRHLKVG